MKKKKLSTTLPLGSGPLPLGAVETYLGYDRYRYFNRTYEGARCALTTRYDVTLPQKRMKT